MNYLSFKSARVRVNARVRVRMYARACVYVRACVRLVEEGCVHGPGLKMRDCV